MNKDTVIRELNFKKKMTKNFVEFLHNKIGMPYMFGGGNMESYYSYPNRGINGRWLGFDCVGGIMASIEETLGLDIGCIEQNGVYKSEWINTFKNESNTSDKLIAGDLIFIDLPTGYRTLNADGSIYLDHIQTYVGNNKIITTGIESKDIGNWKGGSADIRENPDSKAKTLLKDFNRAMGNYTFDPKINIHYARIDWIYLAKKYGIKIV